MENRTFIAFQYHFIFMFFEKQINNFMMFLPLAFNVVNLQKIHKLKFKTVVFAEYMVKRCILCSLSC